MKQKEKEKETKGEKDKEKEKKKETKIEKEKEKETTYGRDTKINFLRNCGPFLFFCLQSVFVFACKKTTKKNGVVHLRDGVGSVLFRDGVRIS